MNPDTFEREVFRSKYKKVLLRKLEKKYENSSLIKISMLYDLPNQSKKIHVGLVHTDITPPPPCKPRDYIFP